MYIYDNILLNVFQNKKIFGQICRENQNTISHPIIFFFLKSCLREIMWEKYGRVVQFTEDNVTRCMRLAYWIPKATNTHLEYVIFIAFPQQQWLPESVSVLRSTYNGCLLNCKLLLHFSHRLYVCSTSASLTL